MDTIDYFAFAGSYPFGEPGDYPLAQLLQEMDRFRVARSWVTDLGSVFRKDPSSANETFLAECRSHGDRIIPLPVIDLSAGTFEADISDLRDRYGIAGVRIAPNYHGYDVEPALADRLLQLLSELRLALCGVCEDHAGKGRGAGDRTYHRTDAGQWRDD